MNTDTGAIRALEADEIPAVDEVELTAAEAEVAAGMEPADRLPWWERLHGRISGGKDRSGSRPAKGTAPKVPQAVARTLAAGDHHKAHDRKATKSARQAAKPHVKRHARSRAHRGHGR